MKIKLSLDEAKAMCLLNLQEKISSQINMDDVSIELPAETFTRANYKIECMRIKINAKCSDLFTATLRKDGKQLGVYDGYVPDFMPGNHYGDYIELDIDTETGLIVNWKKPTKKQLDVFVNDSENVANL